MFFHFIYLPKILQCLRDSMTLGECVGIFLYLHCGDFRRAQALRAAPDLSKRKTAPNRAAFEIVTIALKNWSGR